MINKLYLIQMDTLIKGGELQEGAADLLSGLYAQQIPFVILTEQTGRNRDQICDLFAERDCAYVQTSNVYSSVMAAVDWLIWKMPAIRRVSWFGGSGIREAVECGGFEIDDKSPEIIFAGMNRNMNLKDYSEIASMMRQGAILLSTDSRKSLEQDGAFSIGNASAVHMLEEAAGKKAVDFGRGSEPYLKMTLRFVKCQPSEVLMVGDDFERDIIPARTAGIETVLVTGGEGIMHLGMTDEMHPDWIVEDLTGLLR